MRTAQVKFRAVLIVCAAAAVLWFWFDQLPKIAPDGAAFGPVAEVFAEAVQSKSTDRLLQHARTVPGTKICTVSVQHFLKSAVSAGGANAAGVPNYLLEENIWALILVRPRGAAEFVTVRSAQVWPRHTLECIPAEDAQMEMKEAPPNGPSAGYFFIAKSK